MKNYDFDSVIPQPYNVVFVAKWLRVKNITEEAFRAAGGELVTQENRSLIGFPAYAPDSDFTIPVRWIVNRESGEPFAGNIPSKCIMVTKDAPKGLLGLHGLKNIVNAIFVFLVEGVTDLLALWDAIPPEKRDQYAVISTANGCSENLSAETLNLLAGKKIIVIGDSDKPGQEGAHKKSVALVAKAECVWSLKLPYPIEKSHGKDLRDYLQEGNSFDDLMRLEKKAIKPAKVNQKKPKTISSVVPVEQVPASQDVDIWQLIIDPKQTLSIAKKFLERKYMVNGVKRLHYLDDAFYAWRNNAYKKIETGYLRSELWDFLDKAKVLDSFTDDGDPLTEPFTANKADVDNVLDAVKAIAFLQSDTPIPCWLGTDPSPVSNPSMIIFGKKLNLDLATMQTFAPSPLWFNYNSLDFDYDLNAVCPVWDNFLLELFGDDLESKEALLQFMGLLLIPCTKFQKALLIIGPIRSGKGTIGKTMRKLVGQRNTCSPTTSSFATQFGLQTLIGKTVAIISDARFNGRDSTVAVERILNITGEDELSVERKFSSAATMLLRTRFVIFSNVVPRFDDTSGAIVNRFIMLRLTKSFFGIEDTELDSKLYAELPGIFNQCCYALKKLLEVGHFVQPQSGQEEFDLMRDLASPHQSFVRDRCIIAKNAWTSSEELFAAWVAWCNENNRKPGAKDTFSRNLKAAIPELSSDRRGGKRGYVGIALKPGSPLQYPQSNTLPTVHELCEENS